MKIVRYFLLAVCTAAGAAAAAEKGAKPKPPADADCLACHSDPTLKSEKGRPLFVAAARLAKSVHGAAGLACVDCHTGFDPSEIPHKKKITAVACAGCHDDVGSKHAFHPDLAKAEKSGPPPSVACQTCHGGHDVVPVASKAFPLRADPVTGCSSCHEDVVSEFRFSAHGRALARSVKGAPDCLTCHQRSIIGDISVSYAARKIAQEKMCLSCHLKNPAIRAMMPSAGFISSFETSVHGRALAAGNASAPTCIDCHGSHQMSNPLSPGSNVGKLEIPHLCAKCHAVEAAQYAASVHGTALARGMKDAPVCTDCHGEHNVLPRRDPNSPIAAANISARVCTPCHGSLKLNQKYDLPTDRSKSYADSFHGLDARGGVVKVANCASCHGAHDILPSSDPRSRVARANLATTCGQKGCHPNANAKFALGRVHVTGSKDKDPLLFVIATIYLIVIIGTIGGMLAHNALDFLRRLRRRFRVRMGREIEAPAGSGVYLRMTLFERLQHGGIALPFILLVVTGFMLHYPDAAWVRFIRRINPRAFGLRSVLHRAAGAVMIATSLVHVAYIVFTVRGRQFVKDIWLRPRDLKDAWKAVKYNLGLSKERPLYGRFSYAEKTEYWALVWGTIVMSATGIVMWFDNTFIGLLTKLGYDVSRTIHFYEAWLATLAIGVWHLYFVIFNPDEYPMNLAWLTGMLSEKEMEEEHPLELERIRRTSAPAPVPGTPPVA
ncbi:MAG TPA: cytochrome b/b6 domain-containing protein [Thermoanaerobaculia bacterium]|nr:cytochrome b/b6 domain-containing protein [Thermoanaerobaculia bacterium]